VDTLAPSADQHDDDMRPPTEPLVGRPSEVTVGLAARPNLATPRRDDGCPTALDSRHAAARRRGGDERLRCAAAGRRAADGHRECVRVRRAAAAAACGRLPGDFGAGWDRRATAAADGGVGHRRAADFSGDGRAVHDRCRRVSGRREAAEHDAEPTDSASDDLRPPGSAGSCGAE
jgi:hypothetical protein